MYNRIYHSKTLVQTPKSTSMTQRRGITIVALTKYPDIFASFDTNVKEFAPTFDRVLVVDGIMVNPVGWSVVQGPYTFSMAGNANLGWKAADPTHDILYIGDDVRFTAPDSVEKLRDLAHSDPSIGMLSARIIGGADNVLQTNPPQNKTLVYSDRYLALVCTYIKRTTIERVGYLDDETFKGYGWEDVDYSRRVKKLRMRLAVAPQVEVTHGISRRGTETFLRNDKGYTKTIDEETARNEDAFFKKWGDKAK